MDNKKDIRKYILGTPKMRLRLDQSKPYGEQEEDMHDRLKKQDDAWEKWREEKHGPGLKKS